MISPSAAGVATPLLDRAIELYDRCIDMGLGRHDNAVMVDVIASMARSKPHKTKEGCAEKAQAEGQKKDRKKGQKTAMKKSKKRRR